MAKLAIRYCKMTADSAAVGLERDIVRNKILPDIQFSKEETKRQGKFSHAQELSRSAWVLETGGPANECCGFGG